MNGPETAPFEPGAKVVIQVEASYRYSYGAEALVLVNGHPVVVKAEDVRGLA